MANSTTVHQAAQVEGFSLWLDGFETLLSQKQPIAMIEAQLCQRLQNPSRLLRWAIVRVEGSRYLCEGAHLK